MGKLLIRFKKFLKIRHRLIKLHEWINRKTIFVSFILTFIGVWYSLFLAYLGENFHLIQIDKTGKKNFTKIGLGCTIFIIIWTFIMEISKRYYECESEDIHAIVYIKREVSKRIANVCTSKYNTLMTLINNIDKNKTAPKVIISNPCTQLKTIIIQMEECLRFLLEQDGINIGEDDLYISIFYKFFNGSKWHQAESQFPESGLGVDELVNNENTTFSKTLLSKDKFLFWNSKEEAKENNQYIPDSRDVYDENNKLRGSILCYEITCQKKNKKYIKAMLSISTYENKLAPENDEKTVDAVSYNIIQHIIKPFEKRIKIELCLLCLLCLYEKNKKNKSNNRTTKKS